MADESRMEDELDALREAILREAGGATERIRLERGGTLFRQGDPSDALYFLVAGRLRATMAAPDGGRIAVGDIGPGEPVGEIGILTGRERGAEVSAVEDAELLRLPREAIERAAREAPRILSPLAAIIGRRLRRNQLAAVLPRIFGPLDAVAIEALDGCMEWVRLPGGEVLFRQGDPADGLSIIVSGRLRAIAEDPKGGRRILNDMAPGECVGEMALLTGEPRSATVVAIRDSQLVRLSTRAWESVRERHPLLLLGMASILSRRLSAVGPARRRPRHAGTIALIPAGPDVPIEGFVDRLADALAPFGRTLRLSATLCDRSLGIRGAAQAPPDSPESFRLEAWLQEEEVHHRFVLLEADPTSSNWTRRSLREADRVILLARADGDPEPGPIDALLAAQRSSADAPPRTLVLLQAPGTRLPRGTSAWVAPRSEEHIHVRIGDDEDVARLARRIAGRSTGIALGGGGARGFAHLGVLRALREAGVPIDALAGTSMGAVIGALHAMGYGYDDLLAMSEEVFIRGRPHREFTLPVFSIIRSRRLDRLIGSVYGDAEIEDLWIPFACVSSNLTTTAMKIHRRGSLWRAVRASASLPGIFVPVIEGQEILVDGGVIDNLPGDVLRGMCGGPTIVVDVSRETEWRIDRREFPSPWRALASRLLPGADRERVPGILAILLRTILVGSDHRAREVKAEADLCLQPPVRRYGILEFERFREIAETGYEYAKRAIDGIADASLRAALALEAPPPPPPP